MGRQRAENLHRDFSKERVRGREERRNSRDLSKASEDRRGDREWRTYIGISRKRERGRGEKSKSRDLRNRSLKTDGEEEGAELQKGLQCREDREREKASRDFATDLWKRDKNKQIT